ncbi:MAG: hypothetical protein P4M13_00775 [Alphaproteobacteria bacterium]|nr:hypothetical protein [Alphaproteobacteria bacterium]
MLDGSTPRAKNKFLRRVCHKAGQFATDRNLRRKVGKVAAAFWLTAAPVCLPGLAHAVPLTIGWTAIPDPNNPANPDPSVTGYNIYDGPLSGVYGLPTNAGNTTKFTVDLPLPVYLTLTGCTATQESAFAQEIKVETYGCAFVSGDTPQIVNTIPWSIGGVEQIPVVRTWNFTPPTGGTPTGSQTNQTTGISKVFFNVPSTNATEIVTVPAVTTSSLAYTLGSVVSAVSNAGGTTTKILVDNTAGELYSLNESSGLYVANTYADLGNLSAGVVPSGFKLLDQYNLGNGKIQNILVNTATNNAISYLTSASSGAFVASSANDYTSTSSNIFLVGRSYSLLVSKNTSNNLWSTTNTDANGNEIANSWVQYQTVQSVVNANGTTTIYVYNGTSGGMYTLNETTATGAYVDGSFAYNNTYIPKSYAVNPTTGYVQCAAQSYYTPSSAFLELSNAGNPVSQSIVPLTFNGVSYTLVGTQYNGNGTLNTSTVILAGPANSNKLGTLQLDANGNLVANSFAAKTYVGTSAATSGGSTMKLWTDPLGTVPNLATAPVAYLVEFNSSGTPVSPTYTAITPSYSSGYGYRPLSVALNSNLSVTGNNGSNTFTYTSQQFNTTTGAATGWTYVNALQINQYGQLVNLPAYGGFVYASANPMQNIRYASALTELDRVVGSLEDTLSVSKPAPSPSRDITKVLAMFSFKTAGQSNFAATPGREINTANGGEGEDISKNTYTLPVNPYERQALGRLTAKIRQNEKQLSTAKL